MSSLSLVVVLTLLAISFKGSTACVCIQLADETKICLADFGKYIAKFFINFIDFNYKLQFRNIVSFLFFFYITNQRRCPQSGEGAQCSSPLFKVPTSARFYIRKCHFLTTAKCAPNITQQ